jgi:large subunit ribosomal protein L25
MADTFLTLETGRAHGSRSSRRLRREDKIPAILYGFETDPTSVAVGRRELRRALTTEAGTNALLTLDLSGTAKTAVVRDIQRDPVRNAVLHVDFLVVDPNVAINVEVGIVLVGESEAVVKAEGGTVEHLLHTLTVLTRPDNIPNELTIDISGLEIGDTLRVRDIVLPDGVSTDVDPEDAVASARIVQELQIEPEPVEGEELEGEELEGEELEGAEGEGGEPSEGSSDADGGDADGD